MTRCFPVAGEEGLSSKSVFRRAPKLVAVAPHLLLNCLKLTAGWAIVSADWVKSDRQALLELVASHMQVHGSISTNQPVSKPCKI